MSKKDVLNKEENETEIEKRNSKTLNIDSPIKEKFQIIHRNKNIRTLMIRKMEEDEKYNKYIKTEVDDYFNSPDKYFDKNSSVSVNQKIDIKEIKLFKKEPAHHLTTKKSNKNLSNLSPRKKPTLLIQSSGNISNNIQEQLPKYEIIDNEKLKSIFESYRDQNNHNSFLNQKTELKMKGFPFDLSKSLSVQNNRLKSSRNDIKNLRQLSGFLSKRLNKNEKDLLINNIDSYRYKRELINNIESKEFSEIHPRYYWKMNLRRDNELNRKDIFVNIKNIYDPFWSVVVDNPLNKKELAFKSGLDLNSKDLKDFKKNKYLIDNYSKKIKNLEKLENLNVTGKKLFNVEFDREMSSKRRKILHRVFVENGKEILDTDINDVFAEETIYKNYNKDKVRYEKDNKINSFMSRNNNNLV